MTPDLLRFAGPFLLGIALGFVLGRLFQALLERKS